jgi:hypothetical protein
MKTLALILSALVLSSCAALQDVKPADAHDALRQANNACELSKAFTDKTREACDKLRAAQDAARDAAKAVLEAVPESK